LFRSIISPGCRAQKSDMSLSKPINVVQPAEDRFHNDLSA